MFHLAPTAILAPLLLRQVRRRLDVSRLELGGQLACAQTAHVRRRVCCQFVADALQFWTKASEFHLEQSSSFSNNATGVGVPSSLLSSVSTAAIGVGPVALTTCRLRLRLCPSPFSSTEATQTRPSNAEVKPMRRRAISARHSAADCFICANAVTSRSLRWRRSQCSSGYEALRHTLSGKKKCFVENAKTQKRRTRALPPLRFCVFAFLRKHFFS